MTSKPKLRQGITFRLSCDEHRAEDIRPREGEVSRSFTDMLSFCRGEAVRHLELAGASALEVGSLKNWGGRNLRLAPGVFIAIRCYHPSVFPSFCNGLKARGFFGIGTLCSSSNSALFKPWALCEIVDLLIPEIAAISFCTKPPTEH